MSRETPQGSIVRSLCKEFPNTGNLSLAKIAVRDHPLVFSSVEQARTLIRGVRGALGNRSRKSPDKSLHKTPGTAGDAWKNFPKGIVEAPWKPFIIKGPSRCLVLSDIHIPFHDERALLAALRYGIDHKADTILLNGDIADCHAVSKYQTDPEQRNFKREIERTREFFAILRLMFPNARIILKLGNHEERWEKYLYLKAPEIAGVEEFRFDQIFHCADYGIEVVRDQQEIRLGRLTVMHGHEWPGGISSPVNPARGLLLKGGVNALAGHLHRTSQHSQTNMRGEVVSTWSTGCLCDLHPRYCRINAWNLGFAFVTTDKAGVFEVQNLRIIEGEVY